MVDTSTLCLLVFPAAAEGATRIPEEMKLLMQLLEVSFHDIHRHDMAASPRLIPYKGLNVICSQLQLIMDMMNGKL